MKEKSNANIWKVLSLLSGLNLIMMGLCIGIVQAGGENILAYSLIAGLFTGPLVKIFFNLMIAGMGQMTWIFVVVNVLISLGLLIVALIIHHPKKADFKQAQRSNVILDLG